MVKKIKIKGPIHDLDDRGSFSRWHSRTNILTMKLIGNRRPIQYNYRSFNYVTNLALHFEDQNIASVSNFPRNDWGQGFLLC